MKKNGINEVDDFSGTSKNSKEEKTTERFSDKEVKRKTTFSLGLCGTIYH